MPNKNVVERPTIRVPRSETTDAALLGEWRKVQAVRDARRVNPSLSELAAEVQS